MKQLRVAMIAPPWLPLPPDGYGGIENVIGDLVPALRKLGVKVELFTIKTSQLRSDKKHYLYKEPQYGYIHEPLYNSIVIPMAQTLFAFNKILADGKFDLIHSHNGWLDPLAAVYADKLPPLLNTLHGPPFTTPDRLEQGLPDNYPMWRELGKAKPDKLRFVGISKSLLKTAPTDIKKLTLGVVHNGINPSKFPFVKKKDDYMITLARSHPDKGQAIAVKTCLKLGINLRLAGTVGSLTTPKQVILELANPLSPFRSLPDFRYFSDKIFPYLDNLIQYVGDISGKRKLDFISRAKALLFPIQWDEPFGMAPIEALACGTPVVAMARGALPEIIEHGVNGFLANNQREFTEYVKRIDEIDPAACRQSVKDRFSATSMAEKYINYYAAITGISRSSVIA